MFQNQLFVPGYLSLIVLCLLLATFSTMASSRFSSNYPCSDAVKTCASSGTRTVEGFQVHRDCWEWSYAKTCNYPSRNDCRLYEHCYAVGDKGCLLKDSLGSCINMQREFSCKRWVVVNKENKTARMDFKEKPGKDGLICKGIPCMDGNCVDKSFETNGQMMDSLSKLYATSEMNPDKDGNFNLFQGSNQHCTKKATGHSNCCRIDDKGWGKELGAKCTKDEQTLVDMRSKNLCVYVGKEKKKKAGIPILVKHRYCCFGNLLDKVVQVEGRKQLGRNFGSGSNPDCRGLTLEEIQKIDWNKIDFSEFIEDLKVKFAGSYKAPNANDLAATIEGSLSGISGFDADLSVAGSVDSESFDASNPSNLGGVNSKLQDDSWESTEERRFEHERSERDRLAKLEAERQEQQRLAKLEAERLEKERLVKIAEENRRLEQLRLAEIERKRRLAAKQKQIWAQVEVKEKELVVADARYEAAVAYWNREGSRKYPSHNDPRYLIEWAKVQPWQDKTRALRQEINDLRQQAREAQ